jgi:hypothetical protein
MRAYGSGLEAQSAAAVRGKSLAERIERQTAVDRSSCSRFTSRRSPVRAGHRPYSRQLSDAEPPLARLTTAACRAKRQSARPGERERSPSPDCGVGRCPDDPRYSSSKLGLGRAPRQAAEFLSKSLNCGLSVATCPQGEPLLVVQEELPIASPGRGYRPWSGAAWTPWRRYWPPLRRRPPVPCRRPDRCHSRRAARLAE